jgi:hypothetical protein
MVFEELPLIFNLIFNLILNLKKKNTFTKLFSFSLLSSSTFFIKKLFSTRPQSSKEEPKVKIKIKQKTIKEMLVHVKISFHSINVCFWFFFTS